jgi:hypothetical protein
VRRVAEPP